MIAIEGAIEKIEGAWIYGWARPSEGTGDFKILVLDDDTVIGSDATFFARVDLGGNFGFRICCVALVDALHVLAGRVRVMACRGRSDNPIRILSSVRRTFVRELISTAMQDFTIEDIDHVREAISELPGALRSEGIASGISAEKRRTLQLLNQAGHVTGSPSSATDLTFIPVEVSLVSPDGTALLGRDGEVYLVGGGNRVLEQFLMPQDDPKCDKLAAMWHAAVLERARLLNMSGHEFLQMIIPEKLSVYPDQFPARVPTPSPLLMRIEADLGASEASAYTVFGLRELLAAMPPAQIFPRFDSHLTTRAAHALFVAQLRIMGLSNPFPIDLSERQLTVGDLARRFFGVPLYDELEMPSADFVHNVSTHLEVVHREAPATGHIGSRVIWRNVAAPFNLKVVAFANSFFERGGSARGLSWWCE